MDEKTSIKELGLPTIYENGLLRYGFLYVEDLEEYYARSKDALLSNSIRNFGKKGDYLVKDSLTYYRKGYHLPKPDVILEQEYKNRVINAFLKLSLPDKERLANYAETLLK